MRHRQLLTFLVAVVLGVALTGCEDFLSIDPEQSIESDQAFANQSRAESALVGMYSGLQGPGAYGGFFVPMSDFTAQNANFGGSFTTWQQARDFNVLATHGPSQDMWEDFYDTINRANNIIAQTPNIEGAEQAFVTRAVNEARFVRALSYFNLVRLYARPYNVVNTGNVPPTNPQNQAGVPVVTDPTADAGEELQVPRASVADVYNQIVSDLQAARNNLSAASSGGQITATADAATALLAKVRLYQGQYATARDLAEQVITGGPFSLASAGTIAEQQGQSSESIFSVDFSEIDNTGVNNHPSSFYTPSPLGGRGDITVVPGLIETIQSAPGGANDQRGPGGIMYQFGGNTWTEKWDSPNQADDAMVLRLSEMYLIAAETHVRTRGSGGSQDQARDYVNAVREKNGAGPIPTAGQDAASGQELIDDIIRERRIELAFEGDRRHDIVRLGRTLESNTSTASLTQRIFPIPAREIDENSELSQNPGY